MKNKQTAFTLLEIMVTTAILVILVSFLVVIVRSSMNTWRTSEHQSALFAQARRLSEIFREDLSSIPSSRARGGSTIGLIGDHTLVMDSAGKPKSLQSRLRFVRTIEGEAGWWLTRKAGRQLLADKYIDLDQDYQEASRGLLKPPGGLMEVLYTLDPKNPHRLLRSIRSPIGGPDSFFDPSFLSKKKLEDRGHFRVLADNVIYLEFRYWSPKTTSWALPLGENLSTKDLQKSPLICWDSTRKTFLTKEYRELYEKLYRDECKKYPLVKVGTGSSSLLPQKILITLVLRDPHTSKERINLTQKIDEDTKTISLSSVAKLPRGKWELPYLMIGQEWVRYESISGSSIFLGTGGTRGARLTFPAVHTVTAPVEVGRTFRWVVDLPCGTTDSKD